MIGEGAFAKVYEVDENKVRKVFHRARRRDRIVRKEVRALVALSTGSGEGEKHFVYLIDHDKTSITMQRADGRDLFDYIADTDYPRRVAHVSSFRHVVFEIAKQLFTALDYMHTKLEDCCVIHYDIKPENVRVSTDTVWNKRRNPTLHDLYTQRFTIKILDFGAASVLYRKPGYTDQLQRLGNTIEYQSPEGLLALPITPASDVWSVGCTLFTTLTGELLFDVRPEHVSSSEPDVAQDARAVSLMERTLGPITLRKNRRRDLFRKDDELHARLIPRGLARRQTLRQRLKSNCDTGLTDEAHKVISACLAYEPKQRQSAIGAIELFSL